MVNITTRIQFPFPGTFYVIYVPLKKSGCARDINLIKPIYRQLLQTSSYNEIKVKSIENKVKGTYI